MISNPVIFYSASCLIIVSALITLLAKNIIYSLLASIVAFFTGALFFYMLGSEYNAIIQAAIYGFAVPLLIGLSIMFCTNKNKTEEKKHFATSYITVLSSLIFILAFVYLIMLSLAIIPDTFNNMDVYQINSFETINAFAKGIMINYVWAFELVSLLLTIVIAGIGLIYKKDRSK